MKPMARQSGPFTEKAMDHEKKLWGTAYPLYLADDLEVVAIDVKRGGHSSDHCHRGKHNAFFVLQGRLRVTVGPDREVDLTPQSPPLEIRAGVRHRFLALEPSRALEVYRSAPGTAVNRTDIVRFDEGGVTSG
jgi:mannose-6-phosphate isomerase-like protein (cupin superfamily)